jgi:hypothetical protein
MDGADPSYSNTKLKEKKRKNKVALSKQNDLEVEPELKVYKKRSL